MSVVGCLLCWMGVFAGACCLLLVVEYCLSIAGCCLSGVDVGGCWLGPGCGVSVVGCRLLIVGVGCRSPFPFLVPSSATQLWRCFIRFGHRATHRVAMAILSGVHSIMDGEISPAWWGLGFHSIYHHEQSSGVRSSRKVRYTSPIYPLFLYVLCGFG